MSTFVSPRGAEILAGLRVGTCPGPTGGVPSVQLVACVPSEECGCPEEIWIIDGLEAVIHFEPDGSSEGFISAGDWEVHRTFRSRSMAELRAQLFAWIAEIQDPDFSPSVQQHREIFVFGSNLRGVHGKGAALHAARHHGAVRGVGEGLTGNAYAIPTKDRNLRPLPLEVVEASIQRFCDFARAMPEARFLVTPVGTGLARIPKQVIWRSLSRAGMPANCVLTSTWME